MGSLGFLCNANPPPSPPGSVLCGDVASGALVCGARGSLLVGTRPQRGGGLWIPKLSYRTMCFVGAGSAEHFVLGIGQGKIFLFNPMCLY